MMGSNLCQFLPEVEVGLLALSIDALQSRSHMEQAPVPLQLIDCDKWIPLFSHNQMEIVPEAATIVIQTDRICT